MANTGMVRTYGMNKEIQVLSPEGIIKITQDSLFIIAEVGNQFGGSLIKAKELAKAAKDTGADAVKYIFWFPDEIMADKTQMYSYETNEGTKTEPMFDLLDRLRLPIWEWQQVKRYCDKIGIVMMATINSPGGFDYALDLGLPILKLSSWDWNFTELWQWCARTMLPVIADIGPATSAEFDRNLQIFREERNKNLMLLHCFHTNLPEQMNMKMIASGPCLAGYSATDANDDLDCMSVGLGACILEKRLTLSRKDGILHDAVSKEPCEFKDYVTRMQNLKLALGDGMWHPSDEDLRQRKLWFRRIVADTNIPEGVPILRTYLEAKRGETGISPERMDEIVGKIAKGNIRRNDDIRESDF